MGLYLGGPCFGRIFVSEMWGGGGVFLGGLIFWGGIVITILWYAVCGIEVMILHNNLCVFAGALLHPV